MTVLKLATAPRPASVAVGKVWMVLTGSKQDVVVGERSALGDGDSRPRSHLDLFAPAVHHGEADLGILLDEELGDADMQSALHVRRCGAAGDDMQLRAFLGDDDVVHALVEVGRSQV